MNAHDLLPGERPPATRGGSPGGHGGEVRTVVGVGAVGAHRETRRIEPRRAELEPRAALQVPREQSDQRSILGLDRFEGIEQLAHAGHHLGRLGGLGQLYLEQLDVAAADGLHPRLALRVRVGGGGE